VIGKLLVAGVGNVFLGDDGFGVEVVRRLSTEDLPEWVRVVDYGIRGMHLAYDLAGGDYHTTVLVDATGRGDEPGTVYVVELDPAAEPPASVLDAHGMQPDVVLGLVRLLGGDPGRVLLVGCEPAVLDHRMALSPPVARAVATAVTAVLDVIREHRASENGGKGTGVPCASAFPAR
jgi:hydrogenase maturation protease